MGKNEGIDNLRGKCDGSERDLEVLRIEYSAASMMRIQTDGRYERERRAYDGQSIDPEDVRTGVGDL